MNQLAYDVAADVQVYEARGTEKTEAQPRRPGWIAPPTAEQQNGEQQSQVGKSPLAMAIDEVDELDVVGRAGVHELELKLALKNGKRVAKRKARDLRSDDHAPEAGGVVPGGAE